MRTSIGNMLRRSVLMGALSLTMLLVLLRWNDANAPACAVAPPRSNPAARAGDISAAWGMTESYSHLVPMDDRTTALSVWNIYTYNVIITFPKGLLNTATAFTFTPKSRETLPVPLTTLDYFFTLDGDYIIRREIEAQAVSFVGGKYPEFEWRYSNNLGGIDEQTLTLYYYTSDLGTPPAQIWKSQTGSVDAENNKTVSKLDGLGKFGFGGYKSRNCLPVILNNR